MTYPHTQLFINGQWCDAAAGESLAWALDLLALLADHRRGEVSSSMLNTPAWSRGGGFMACISMSLYLAEEYSLCRMNLRLV